MKSAMIKVTVAAGCHVSIPHPSGIAELPRKVLNGGDTFEATPETVKDLLTARLILDPATGRPVEYLPGQPRPYEPSPGVSISVGGGPMRRVQDGQVIDLTGGIPPEPASSTDHAPLPPPHDCTGGRRVQDSQIFLGAVVIEQADGKPWPSY